MNDDDIVLYPDQSLPDTGLWWEDANGQPINFASGWTFTVELIDPKNVVRLTKTSGIAGFDGAASVNLSIAWDADELADLEGRYRMRIIAERADGRVRIFRPERLPTVIVPALPTQPAP